MIDTLLDLPVHLRQRLAGALEADLLPPGSPPTFLAAVLGLREGVAEVAAAIHDREALGISGHAAGAWLSTVESAFRRVPKPDLVGARGAGRPRVQRLRFLLRRPQCVRGARARTEKMPGLKVTLLLNIQRRRRYTRAADQLVGAFADRFWNSAWPRLRTAADGEEAACSGRPN